MHGITTQQNQNIFAREQSAHQGPQAAPVSRRPLQTAARPPCSHSRVNLKMLDLNGHPQRNERDAWVSPDGAMDGQVRGKLTQAAARPPSSPAVLSY